MSESVRESAKKPEASKEDRMSQTRKSDYSQPVNSSIDRILFLQRTIGNQAVCRLMKSGALQAKLKISQPDDIYEQEADRAAEQVMRMPAPVQRKCTKCKEGIQKQSLKTLQGSDNEVTPEIESDINSLIGSGNPLPESSRAFFEPLFGYDFSRVHVHTDTRAADSVRAVNARAFTVGRDVVFGEYAPTTREGQRLLAHELTHTIQQEVKAPMAAQQLTSTIPEDAGERQAHAASDAVALENAAPIVSQSVQQLARQDQVDNENGGSPDVGPSDAGPTDASLPGGVPTPASPEAPSSPDDRSLSEKDPTLLSDEELLAEYQSTLAASDPAMEDYFLALDAEVQRRQLIPAPAVAPTPAPMHCPTTGIHGKDVERDFFYEVVEQLSDVPQSDFAVNALMTWAPREATNAFWNPLATTWKMSPICNFNSAGVQNYTDQPTGVKATAKTLNASFYNSIRRMLRLETFDRGALSTSIRTWGGANYIDPLLNDWQRLFNQAKAAQ